MTGFGRRKKIIYLESLVELANCYLLASAWEGIAQSITSSYWERIAYRGSHYTKGQASRSVRVLCRMERNWVYV